MITNRITTIIVIISSSYYCKYVLVSIAEIARTAVARRATLAITIFINNDNNDTLKILNILTKYRMNRI